MASLRFLPRFQVHPNHFLSVRLDFLKSFGICNLTMNTTLIQLQQWLTELGITCQSVQPTCLMVSRDGIANFGTTDEILAEVKASVSKRIIVSYQDDNWVHFETI